MKCLKQTQSFSSSQRGAGLIEVLVAILIFSIGMLGVAALTSAAIRYQTGNVARGAVAASINDYADRLRGNLDAANGYTPVATSPAVSPTTGTGYVYTVTYTTQQSATIAFPTSPNCATTTCTPAELANYDLSAWRLALRSNLPSGAGYISGDIRSGFDVTVMWLDKDYTASNDSEFTDVPEASRVCSAADSANSAAARFCCPQDAQAAAGVRCYTTKILP
jgi:type IV pilus assembly protein PilV